MSASARALVGMPRERVVAFAMLLLSGILAGGAISLTKLARVNGVPLIPFVFWMTAISASGLVIISLARRAPPALGSAHLRSYAIFGLLATALPQVLISWVSPNLPPSIFALNYTLIPALVFVLALALGIERFRWPALAGIVLGLLGVLLIVLPEASLPDPAMAGWVIVGLSVPLCFAFSIISGAKFRPPRARSISMAAGVQTMALLYLGVLMAIEGSWWAFDSGFDTGAQALLAVGLLYVIFWICFFEITRLAGPVFFSTINYIGALAGVGWGMAMFGDALSGWIWAALALMFAGLYVGSLGRGREP